MSSAEKVRSESAMLAGKTFNEQPFTGMQGQKDEVDVSIAMKRAFGVSPRHSMVNPSPSDRSNC